MSTPPQSPQPADQPPQQPAQQPAIPSQPTAYPYPNPQSPPPGSFYAQPTLVGQPAVQPPAGAPQPGNPYAQAPQYGPVPVPSAGGGGGAGKAVLWAVVGAAVASAAWAGGVFLLGGKGDSADLRGYSSPADMCSSADYSSFKDEYTEQDSSPTHTALKDTALDESYCSLSLKKSGSTYADAYLSMTLDMHKKTDPGPEFTATWKKYGDSHKNYDVDPVQGIGDEAYLVTQDTTSGSSSGSRYATLAVRDGWVTYTMSYSAYLSSYDDDKDPPVISEVSDWLKTDAKATLGQLKD
ncbi:hypothetical protein GCM10010503_17400 [Streptomyces lucensis JCM 4490]|uniref:Uncharacterized protein n=1 Tax=Streptomyces lucensis JCM 4490 TaxID=1306176 RepID=A0A918J0H6_9ACTN|nr:hypothetical protein [Streptomyces lucensis]GGW41707.1 hypothetical protein GCM10010503_17400 [Streptomyces lucensis JCM 4490]